MMRLHVMMGLALVLSIGEATKIETLDDLKTFFKTSFIQKETGYITEQVDSSTGRTQQRKYADGFNPTWSVYRFHHVCLRGGSDGLYVGMNGVPQHTQPHSEYSMTIEEWNDFIGSRYNSPISAMVLDDAHFDASKPPHRHHNSSLFTNCNRQHSMAFNPSHLMFSIGWLYEYSSCATKNLGRRRLFKHDISLPYSHFILHQCPDPNKSYWMWGKTALQVIQEKLVKSYLIKRNQTQIIRKGKESDPKEVMCFDDMYLSARSGRWIEGSDNVINFKKDVATVTGEPAEALKISERAVEFHESLMFQTYCTPGQMKPTSARIKLFQRTENLFPRTIVNQNDVIALLQRFTTIPVETITTTETMSIESQIQLFNSFDILVTTHGAHLANGLFAVHPYTRAVVEIVPFVYDSAFFRNYINDLDYAEYLVSSGHLTPKHEKNSTSFCAFLKNSDFDSRKCRNQFISNPPRISQEWLACGLGFHSRSCDTWVNLTILEKDMNNLITNSLCKSQEGQAPYLRIR